jgi:hypothetical protein
VTLRASLTVDQLELFDSAGYLHPSFTRFCLDCGIDTLVAPGHYYNLHDEVWLEAHPAGHGKLCLDCVEDRLGRALTPDDFTDGPINSHPDVRAQIARRRTR